MLENSTTGTHGQSLALFAGRLAVGMLFIWWGSARIAHPEAAAAMADRVYSGFCATPTQQIAVGALQVLLGSLIALGIGLRIALPALLLITICTISATWQVILDPFALWLSKTDSTNHTHYSNALILAATLILIAFQKFDRLGLGRLAAGRKPRPVPHAAQLSVISGGLPDP
ncbi:MAG: hypothetical protein AAF666_00235 [Pseudomonadota bacterium]